jgi:ParB-like chromosome segregation protein Spo0J
MNAEQSAEFQADIAERGIRVPIEVVGTQIVDGRSRYLAATKLGIEQVPVIDAPLQGDDPVLYMLRAATRRRHLTDDQSGFRQEVDPVLQSTAEHGRCAHCA